MRSSAAANLPGMDPSEARSLATVVLDRLAPRLPEVAADSDAAAPPGESERHGPVHRLYRLVAGRLHALGEQEALADLVRDPRNNSLVKRLLATAAADDPAYAAELDAAVAALPVERKPAETTSTPATESTAEEPASRPHRRRALWLSLGAAAVVTVLALVVGRSVVADLRDAGGLTSDSTCAEYRQAPPEERVAAIRQIGLAKGVSDAHNPLVMTALDQLCDTQPTARLGDLVARFR